MVANNNSLNLLRLKAATLSVKTGVAIKSNKLSFSTQVVIVNPIVFL